MSANGPSLWDVAGLIHNAVQQAAPTVETVVKEAAQVAQEVTPELTEIAASSNGLGATESASIVHSIAPAVSNMSTALVRYLPFTPVSTPLEMCGLDEAPASSLFGYALGGLSVVSGLVGLYGISRLRADTKKLVSESVHEIAKDSQDALAVIKACRDHSTALALLNNEANMRKLIAEGAIANIAKMTPTAMLVGIQCALEPVVLRAQEELKEISGPSSSNVAGTQSAAASSTPAPEVKLADTILTSDAGKTVLAKIRQHANAVAVLEQMNLTSLRSLEKNAPKWASNSQFMNLNAQQLVTFLVGAAAKCQQVIAVEAPKPATTTLKI